MSTGFTLLEDDTFFKRVVSVTGDIWDRGVKQEGVETISYEEFTGLWEYYNNGRESKLLPAGVSSDEAIVINTEVVLFAHSDLEGSTHKADVVYLEDPILNPSADSFVVFKKLNMVNNTGYELLSGNVDYVCIRESKM